MRHQPSQAGYILPVVVSLILTVAIIAGGVLNYVLYGARAAGVHIATSQCRLAAQTALERNKIAIGQTFNRYYRTYPSLWDNLSWFDSWSAQSLGSGSYVCALMNNGNVNGCTVNVRITAINRSPASSAHKYARVTLQSTATRVSPAGISVSRTIEEVVEYAQSRSPVFNYAYFVNNYGWFQGGGVTANGEIRSNGDMSLDGSSYVNGLIYSSVNAEVGATGKIISTAKYKTRDLYWSGAGTRARPTNPPSALAGVTWDFGYDYAAVVNTAQHPYQDILPMPFLGDLDVYRTMGNDLGSTIKQNGVVLVSGCFSGTGPSGLATGADKGSIVLDGTSKPIVIDGPVVINGDVIIKGTVSGQGTIYAGRNIHIVGDLIYSSAPSWPKPDTDPNQTLLNNTGKDMLGLIAKGNIVLGNYTNASWLSSTRSYITTPFVKAYTCDPTDASIGYPSTFPGNYTASDTGQKIVYTYNKTTKVWSVGTPVDRKYYESAVGDKIVGDYAQSAAITRIDAVLYNNHAVMGVVGGCAFNGALISRDEAIIYSGSVTFNWDIRLGSASPDGKSFFIELPMVPVDPRVLTWREVL